MSVSAADLEAEFLASQKAVAKQGDVVRALKAHQEDGKVERVRGDG